MCRPFHFYNHCWQPVIQNINLKLLDFTLDLRSIRVGKTGRILPVWCCWRKVEVGWGGWAGGWHLLGPPWRPVHCGQQVIYLYSISLLTTNCDEGSKTFFQCLLGVICMFMWWQLWGFCNCHNVITSCENLKFLPMFPECSSYTT